MNRLVEFETNVYRNRTALLRYISRKVNCVADAEDILQKSLMTMWRRYDTFSNETNFMTWACTVASFESKNTYRKHQRCPVLFDDVVFTDVSRYMSVYQSSNQYEAVQLALNQLEDKERQLIVAVHINGEDVKDIARSARKAPRTIYNNLYLARKKLAKYILHHDNSTN